MSAVAGTYGAQALPGRQMFDHYNRSFNVLGMRTGKKPLGYRAHVEFGYRRELGNSQQVRLTFPTQLRYDTEKAVSPRQVQPLRASTRSYTMRISA